MGSVILFLIIGLVCIVLPIQMRAPVMTQFISAGFGVALIILSTIILTITRLYRKTSANEAFVRTGMGGTKIIMDGGALVIPVVHKVVPVSLETMKLTVKREGKDALITKDYLRADVQAEFFIRVQADRDNILNAARSLGERSVNSESVNELVGDKLVSALRSVAATKELEALNEKRDEFASAVNELVKMDLAHNGLTLETVTVSRLDQTDQSHLSAKNVFDAQGLKKITEITMAADVERNRLERDAERAKAQKDIETRKLILALEQERAAAEAMQATQVANIQAERDRERKEFAIQQEQAVKEAQILQEQVVQVASIERDKALIVKEQEKQQTDILREQAIEISNIAKQQALQIAEQQRQITVAQKEAERAAAEATALLAQAEKEKANQQVLTVQTTLEAQREAEKRLIAAKQVIEQDKLKQQMEADVMAYKLSKEAEGQLQAAQLEYQSKIRLAEAEAKAKEIVAEGELAQQMVPVNVTKEQVNVERAKLEVKRQEFEYREKYKDAAIDFEKIKIGIEASKEVRMALAEALGKMMSSAKINLFGDPTALSQMSESLLKSASFGAMIDGFLSTAPSSVQNVANAVSEIVEKLSSQKEKMEKTNPEGKAE